MSDIHKLILSYGYEIHSDVGQSCAALGLGDILFRLLHMQEKLDKSPFYINIFAFLSNEFYPNPYEQLKMRLELFKDILSHHRTLSQKDIIFVEKKNFIVHQDFNYDDLKKLKLDMLPTFWEKIPLSIDISTEYIVFHTKLRLFSNYNYESIKIKIANFCASFISKYKIILLGEQIFPLTCEVNMHGITTLYDSLLKLNINNDIIDKTEKDIYSNINYTSYRNDLNIIKNAKYNICFGLGGHLCSSLIFGNTLFCPIVNYLQPTTFNIDGATHITQLDDFLEILKIKLGA
jgi:hypothetical protein